MTVVVTTKSPIDREALHDRLFEAMQAAGNNMATSREQADFILAANQCMTCWYKSGEPRELENCDFWLTEAGY